MNESVKENNINEKVPLPNLRGGDISDLDYLVAPERARTPGLDFDVMCQNAGMVAEKPISWKDAVVMHERYKQWLESTPPLKSGFHGLDEDVELRPGYFVVIGARPNVGKTAFMAQLARFYARQVKVMFFTLEQSIEQIVGRMTSSGDVSGIEGNLMFSEESSLDAIELTIKAYKPDVVFIDQLSKVKLSHDVENVRMRFVEVTNRLQPFARDNNCMIVISAQESRMGKGLPPADNASFKESGSIEEDADVLMILRAENEDDSDVMSDERRLYVTKTRVPNAKRGSYKLHYHPDTDTFSDAFVQAIDDDVPFSEGEQEEIKIPRERRLK